VGGLTPELGMIRGRLEAYAEDLFASLQRADQRARGQCYLRGLMLDGRRKSIQPMAQRLGEVHYQALHHFVATSPWDWRPVRRRLAQVLVGALSPTAWVVDDTGFPKDGPCSVGVQRQYSGTLGKTANCQLGVSVNAVCEQASCPLNWRLFLPESWDDAAMATRRAACHLPAAVQHRPKWRLVLDMLDELAGWELSPPVLLADCGDGEIGEFRGGLDTREIPYVVEVRSATSAYAEQVRPTTAPYTGKGPASPPALPRQAILAGQPGAPSRAAGLCGADLAAGQQGPATRPLPGAAGPPGGGHPRRQARADGAELPLHWLLVEWPTGKPAPVKYWLSNLPPARPLVELVRLARLRWRIEQDYRALKGALGLDHFEGRGLGGWHHHVTLVSVAHGFLTLERLRHPKPAASA
jgi:SRSO17 transposase